MADEIRWSAQELKDELDRYETELRAEGKARNTINTYVQHPERFIKWLERRHRPTANHPNPKPDFTRGSDNLGGFDDGRVSGRGSRYDPLKAYLDGRSDPVVLLSFEQIEEILAAPLPPSAYRYPAWWANEQAGSHVHARAWLGARRRTTNVNLNGETVEFEFVR
jgi:hypothetical protein